MSARPVAVVTGAASGFGLALATHCAAKGYDVVLLDRDGERVAAAAEALAGAHGGRALSRRVDVAAAQELEQAAAEVSAELGRVDLLLSNVGVQHFGAVETVTDDVWRWVLDVNVVGSARTVRAFLPLLRATPGARLAFTASANVLGPAARLGAYQASKAAVVALAETLRLELAADDVAVSVVYPSGMMTRHLESSAEARPSALGPAAAGGVEEADLIAMMESRPMSELDLADAEVAAANALAGVLAGEPHVITHGELRQAVSQHAAELDEALDRVAVRQPRTPTPTPTPTPSGGAPVDDVEALHQLKARYFRLMDTKDWAGFRELFAEDVTVDVSADGAGVFQGRDAFLAMLEPTLADVVTVHHGHMPEITLTSATTAEGIWAMEDHLQFGEAGPVKELHGYGHYHETYVKQDGRWLVQSTRLARLRLDVVA